MRRGSAAANSAPHLSAHFGRRRQKDGRQKEEQIKTLAASGRIRRQSVRGKGGGGGDGHCSPPLPIGFLLQTDNLRASGGFGLALRDFEEEEEEVVMLEREKNACCWPSRQSNKLRIGNEPIGAAADDGRRRAKFYPPAALCAQSHAAAATNALRRCLPPPVSEANSARKATRRRPAEKRVAAATATDRHACAERVI